MHVYLVLLSKALYLLFMIKMHVSYCPIVSTCQMLFIYGCLRGQ